MSDENSTSDVGFKCDVNLFFEGVNNANIAKSSVRNTIETANSMADIEGIGRVIVELNNCNIDILIAKIEALKSSLLNLDSEFANQYFKLVKAYIKGLDPETLGEDYVTQYIASEKEYWNTLVAMLEKNQDNLSEYMKKQLNIAKEMAGYYNITDDLGANNIDCDKIEELYNARKECEINILKLNGLSGDALDKAVAELDEKYNIYINSDIYNAASKQMLLLNINDENYQDSYINLLNEQANSQIELVKANKDLTVEEKTKLITEIYGQLRDSKNIVRINVLSNEFNKLDITAADYEEKSKNLLDLQKYYKKQLYRSDKSLTPEQLEEKINELDLQYDNLFLSAKSAKIQSDINSLDETAENYDATRLGLFEDLRECSVEQLKLAGFTDEQIQEQLGPINDEIYRLQQNDEWNKMSDVEKFFQNAFVAYASVRSGISKVGENITDSLVMATGIFGNSEKVAEYVKTDVTEEAYATWMKLLGINDNAAYSEIHNIGTKVGNVVGYAGISAIAFIPVPGARVVAAVLGGLAAAGSAEERALNSGATYAGACWVGGFAGALGAISGAISGGFAAGLKGKIIESVFDLGKDALIGALIGTIEPGVNQFVEYFAYAKNSKDANGNLLYDNWWDYFKKSGAWMNMLVGAGAGALSAVASGLIESYKAKKLLDFKKQCNEIMDSMSPDQRTNEWAEYYSNKYGDKFEGKFSGHGDAVDPTSYVDPMAEISNVQLEKQNIKVTYESVKESIKKSAHGLSKADNFQQLDASIDSYYANTTKKVAEYDAWNIAEERMKSNIPGFKDLSEADRNALISAEANKLKTDINNTAGASYFEQLINSKELTDTEKLGILEHTYTIADTAKINGKFALTGVDVDGAPSSHVTIEDYYHDISLKDQGLLNSSITQEYTDYVKNGYINPNGTNTVTCIYANDNLKYAINIPGEKDAYILQKTMWERKPIIEVDMNGKSFGRSGDRQFVSPISDSDQLFSSIQNAKSPVDTQKTVGAATGLPTSGNDRLTRISLDTTEQVAIHNGLESASCKEALSGGLPVYKVDGIYHKMREATIDAINLGQSDLSKLNLIVDNFDPKTGDLISRYKLIVNNDGKTFLKLLQ